MPMTLISGTAARRLGRWLRGHSGTLAQASVRVHRERPSGELGPEEAKEFRDTGKYGGEEHTQKGAECAERSSQIHVLVLSAENGRKQYAGLGCPPCLRGHS
jgi:hypothetical protein